MSFIVSIVCFLLAIILIVLAIKRERYKKQTKSWVSTSGVVSSNEQNIESDGDSQSIMQNIEYSFVLNGFKYDSFLKFRFDNIYRSNQFFENYKTGDEIEILYNPKNPNQSTLKNFEFDIHYSFFAFAFMLFMIGLIILLTIQFFP